MLILLAVLAACSARAEQSLPTAAPTVVLDSVSPAVSGDLPRTEAEVPRVTVEEAQAAFESGAAVLVDVRSPGAFEASHIAGSISVPLGQIERDLASVPLNREQWIITYCT